MDRSQILNDYRVEGDRIASPGKFEGEPIYAPFFYDEWGNGFASPLFTDGVEIAIFYLGDEDRAEFPELGSAYALTLVENESGFVITRLFETEAEFKKWLEKVED